MKHLDQIHTILLLHLPTTYSASSTVVNVDIASLTEEAQGRFFGYIKME